jgi:hypothetical protein
MALGLLVGSAVGVASQSDDAHDQPPAGFTVKLVCSDETPVFASEQSEGEFAPGIVVTKLGTPTWSLAVHEASDPRLDGTATLAMNGDLYARTDLGPDESSFADVFVASLRIENDDGLWEGSTYMLDLLNERQFASDVLPLVGDGAYAGLVALTEIRQGTNICELDLKGAIIEGDLPVIPEIAPVG